MKQRCVSSFYISKNPYNRLTLTNRYTGKLLNDKPVYITVLYKLKNINKKHLIDLIEKYLAKLFFHILPKNTILSKCTIFLFKFLHQNGYSSREIN